LDKNTNDPVSLPKLIVGTPGKSMLFVMINQLLADFAAVPLDQLATYWETMVLDDDQFDG
jgi:hypothetical protein